LVQTSLAFKSSFTCFALLQFLPVQAVYVVNILFLLKFLKNASNQFTSATKKFDELSYATYKHLFMHRYICLQSALEATEDLLTAQNTRLRGEITQMEKAVSERISYLERHKAMAVFRISTSNSFIFNWFITLHSRDYAHAVCSDALQKAVENSVPESEITLVNRRFDDLTSKYRDLLQKENHFVAKNVKVEALQVKCSCLCCRRTISFLVLVTVLWYTINARLYRATFD